MKLSFHLVPIVFSSLLATAGCTSSEGSGNGSGIPTCSADITAALEDVGYYPDNAPSGDPITVAAVTPTRLDLQGASGKTSSFKWQGADLTAHFKVGDVVKAPAFDGWEVVTGADTFIAAHSDGQLGFLEDLPATPEGGPKLTLQPDCVRGDTYFALVATQGADTATVKGHQTATLGAYQIHNGSIHSGTSDGEDSYEVAITLLGPLPAAQ